MPKINMTLDEVTKEDIIEQMNKVEALIEGRLDDDNIHQVAGKITALGKSSFNDIADQGNPIYADKFFGESPTLDVNFSSAAVNFKEDVYEKIRDFSWQADKFTVLSKKGTITLNYNNQQNLDKPNVVVVGDTGGISLATQRKIVKSAQAQAERDYYDFLRQPEEVVSIGKQIGMSIVSSIAGFGLGLTAGFAAGGPVGAGVGAIAGSIVGLVGGAVGSNAISGAYSPNDYDDSFDPYRENIQIMLFNHPSNFRPVSMLELTDTIGKYAGDEVRYSSDINNTQYNRQDLYSKNLYAISSKVSIKNELSKDSNNFRIAVGQPMLIDAETTAVAFSVLPVPSDGSASSDNIIESDSDFVTALCEVEILYRIIS